jgi:hypothetical protein
MNRYYSGSDEVERVHMIEDALDRRRSAEEGEEWLAREARRLSTMLEWIHQGWDDDSFSNTRGILQ